MADINSIQGLRIRLRHRRFCCCDSNMIVVAGHALACVVCGLRRGVVDDDFANTISQFVRFSQIEASEAVSL